MIRSKRTQLLASLLLAAALGCSGSKGSPGPTGVTGSTGPTGPSGTSTGTISGTLTYKPAGTALPATAVTVTTLPDSGVTATSGADGTYTLNVPIGVYTVQFSGNAFASAQVANVSVVAGGNATVNQLLTATNPLVVTSALSSGPVGFGQQVTLGVTVSGSSGPYTYAWTPKAANPTAVTLDSATSATPRFTTGALTDIAASSATLLAAYQAALASGATGAALPPQPAAFSLPPRVAFVGVSTTERAWMTYNFDCTVTDTSTGWKKTVTVAAIPTTLASAATIVPVGRVVIANYPGNTATATLSVPSGSTATLQGAATANPYFVPDAPGDYTVTDGATPLTLTAATYVGATPSCGGCHAANPDVLANVAGKFADWGSSAHGNFYFKIGVPSALAALPRTPNDLTLFAAGMDGVEGSHYGPGCYGCHTVGYDTTPGTTNGGFDDVAKGLTPPWTQPDLSTVDYGRYASAVPAPLQRLAGIQCENCHGPLGQHVTTAAPVPKAEWAAEVCNVCHDATTHHDKGYMWKQGKHSDLKLAMLEATVEGRGAFAAHCGRCHSAQGFAAWLDQQQCGNPGSIAIPDASNTQCNPATAVPATTTYLASLGLTVASVQPQTCQACHDPHTTTLRVDDSTGPLPAGFSVTSAGSGALCMMCHNSRNGTHDDTAAPTGFTAPHAADQADVFTGSNAYFVAPYQMSRHAAVNDTCAGCHVKLVPRFLTSSTAYPNHSFLADTSICAACHGSTGAVNGEALQGSVRQALSDIDALAGQKILNKLGAAVSGGATLSATLWNADPAHDESTAAAVAIPLPTQVAFYEVHGQIGLVLTLATPVSVPYPAGARSDSVVYLQMGNLNTVSGGVPSKAFSVANVNDLLLVKALWNRFLVHGKSGTALVNALPLVDEESSAGANASAIHNPSFVQDVLGQTRLQLAKLP